MARVADLRQRGADKDNIEDVCGKINSGCDQYDKRKKYTESAKKILKP